MTVKIEFPLEFVVLGTPVSQQAKRSGAISEWKDRIRSASRSALPQGHFSSDASMAITLFYFPNREMAGDLDNIVKPVLDALCRHVYMDDRQIERIWVQKFEPGNVFPFSAASATLASAIKGEKPILYVRISDDPKEGLTRCL